MAEEQAGADGAGESSSAGPIPPLEEAPTPIFPIRRAGTLPVRHPHLEAESNASGRRRGRTISAKGEASRPQVSSLSKGAEPLDSIPERGLASQPSIVGRQRHRSSGQSEQPSFGLRKRTGTWQSQRPQGYSLNRRPTVLISQPAATSGSDAQSTANFTLAGPGAIEAATASLPYVDPGYTDLNPAYDQPQNIRPVWSLAKPLPRVLRPSMIPTKSELKVQIPEQEQVAEDAANLDLEQGRIEPTLRLGRITSQLQNARAQREIQMLQTLNGDGSLSSPAGRVSGSSFRRRIGSDTPSQVITDEGEDALTETDEDNNHVHDLLEGDWIGEEIPLNADPDTGEVHNMHNHWSVVRMRFREELAELLAVTVQLTIGFSADLAVSSGGYGTSETTCVAWGLATMIGIHIAGRPSGAHLNPAVSIMLWLFRGFPSRKLWRYILAQLLGAFLAALIAFGLYQSDIIALNLTASDTRAAFITYPRQAWIDGATSFFTEFTGACCLGIVIMALGDDSNSPATAGMNPFIMGLVITALSIAFGYNTGIALNGTRDLGPRLALWALGYGGWVDLFKNGYWFYGPWLGSIFGALFGAFLYDSAIFVGGESPVNYDRAKVRRAGRKWKKRVMRRGGEPKVAEDNEKAREDGVAYPEIP